MFGLKYNELARTVRVTKGSRIAIMGTLAALAALLTFSLCACGGASSGSSVASSTASSSTSDASAESSTISSGASAASTASSSASTAAQSAASSAAGGSAPDAAVKNAKGLMMIYPANHMLAGGGSDDPSPMSVEQWAQNCLRYVDSSSALGRELASSPDAAADKAGFNAAAQCVKGTKVVSSDASSVTVEASMLGTQNTWEDAVEYTMTFVVKVNSGGMVTDVTMR